MFEKIVVALDGSPLSERVIASLELLLENPASELLIIRVVPGGRLTRDDAVYEPARAHIRSVVERLTTRGYRVCGEVAVGDEPASEILAFARRNGASLLALTTHARGAIGRFFIGSTTERIIRDADLPVLVVNPWAPAFPLRFERVLVPLDGSERAEEALPFASEVERKLGAEVVLLHVQEVAALEPELVGPDDEARERSTFERAAAALGSSPRTLSLKGFAPTRILDAIHDTEPDVVLMTTHGRTGLARIALGSVTESVVRRAPCPVLVLRSRRAPTSSRAPSLHAAT